MFKKMLFLFMVLIATNTLLYAADGDFVGSKKCLMCHSKVYKKWEQSKMAQAGVQCENCHGSGKAYIKDMSSGNNGLVLMPKIGDCKKCHKEKKVNIDDKILAEAIAGLKNSHEFIKK